MRIAFLTDNVEYSKKLFTSLSERQPLERVTTLQGLQALLEMPEPTVALICLQQKTLETVVSLRQKFPEMNFGLIVMAPSYNLQFEQSCFEHGADHVILFNTPTALIENRLRNLARRLKPPKESVIVLPRLSDAHVFTFENFSVSLDQNTVKYRNEVLKLTPTHHKLIVTFVTRVDQLLTRELLLSLVWHGQNISKRSIDAQISKLKKAFPVLENRLMNLYGRGYVLRSGGSEKAA
jgi:DNA-binding response OmpR family regulator